MKNLTDILWLLTAVNVFVLSVCAMLGRIYDAVLRYRCKKLAQEFIKDVAREHAERMEYVRVNYSDFHNVIDARHKFH